MGFIYIYMEFIYIYIYIHHGDGLYRGFLYPMMGQHDPSWGYGLWDGYGHRFFWGFLSTNVPPRDRQPTYSNSDLLWPAKIGMHPIKHKDLIFVFQQCGLSG